MSDLNFDQDKPIPAAAEWRIDDTTQTFSAKCYSWLQNLDRKTRQLISGAGTLNGDKAEAGDNTDITSLDIDLKDTWSVTVSYPENSRFYPIKPYIAHNATILGVRAFTQAGTATVDFQHNGTSLGSASAISATTSSFSFITPTSGTDVSEGDYLYGIPTSADTAEFLTMEVLYQRKIP